MIRDMEKIRNERKRKKSRLGIIFYPVVSVSAMYDMLFVYESVRTCHRIIVVMLKSLKFKKTIQ